MEKSSIHQDNQSAKHLQGALFHKFRDVMMGHTHINTLITYINHITPKEHVGSNLITMEEKSSNVEDNVCRMYAEAVVGRLKLNT